MKAFTIFKLILLFFLLIIIFIKINTIKLFPIKNFIFYFDSNLSYEYEQKIKGFLKESSEYLNFSELLNVLKCNFPIIKNYTADYSKNSFLILKIFTYNPRLKINQNFVLTENNKLFTIDIFSDSSLLDIPHIEVSVDNLEDFCSSNDFINFLKKINLEIFKKYDLKFTCDNSVFFEDKNRKFILHLNLENFDNEKIKKSELVKRTLADDGKTWICDLRFKDQIVMYIGEAG